jgi:hypothetical protein
LNFKGIQTFKTFDKFYKIPYPHAILDYKFTLSHLYSNIGSFFTSGREDLVQIISKIACHFRGIVPLITNSTLIHTGQAVFPCDLQTLYFDLSDMHSLSSKIREDMAFQM